MSGYRLDFREPANFLGDPYVKVDFGFPEVSLVGPDFEPLQAISQLSFAVFFKLGKIRLFCPACEQFIGYSRVGRNENRLECRSCDFTTKVEIAGVTYGEEARGWLEAIFAGFGLFTAWENTLASAYLAEEFALLGRLPGRSGLVNFREKSGPILEGLIG